MQVDRSGKRPLVNQYPDLHSNLGHGWGVFELTCIACGREFVLVTPVCARGYDCPDCGYHSANTLLQSDLSEMPFIDGPWLTGEADIQYMKLLFGCHDQP